MTAAARKHDTQKSRASKVAKAIGSVGNAVFARIAAALAPKHTEARYVARVTRDFGKTWEEWPFVGYGTGR